ncbi:ROK family protein [Ornithinibacillus sp. L9]|uniref:ROK family protein n=1 Tax=Ornithinibacillus caprae TaxID=2678566 RepID=A0A6N8FFK8_9BACI|nr:ROK family protein [Ornithinibacillus caprae]MUK88225.1 ROK family protein [Ornithinibacillus caprae]
MKKMILRDIRTTLLEIGSTTKVELSNKLKISFPTISKFLAQMEKEGEVISVGLDESSGGRRAKRYRYNPEYMLGLSIFLERSETNYTIFNCLGEIKDQGKFSGVLIDDGLHVLTNYIDKIITANPKISSMAIGVPGAVDGGRIFHIPGYEQFQNIDLKGYFEEHFSIPVAVENDMNAAVFGYYTNRKMKVQSLVYLYSGQNGPGAGIMLNGDVVRGSTFFSGEVQFIPQYNNRNFQQALNKENGSKKKMISKEYEIDAISRLIASFVAIINPHVFIFCEDEVDETIIDKIQAVSSKYIPSEHLPEFEMSDWKQDYLFGLQTLCLDVMIEEISNIS